MKLGFASGDYSEKLEMLKIDYPAFYIAYCMHYNRQG